MRVALDVMGSDYGPSELIEGALLAREQINSLEKIILVGDENLILAALKNRSMSKLEILNTDEYIEMSEPPSEAYRKKKNASITLATRLVKEGKADAVISAGSTGAQLASSLFELGRIKGIKRPAIGVYLPTLNGDKLLLDAGANTNVNAEIIYQFALMGTRYFQLINNISQPKIGLISNGSEESKGNELTKSAYVLLKKSSNLNFYGNVEGKDISSGIVDVYVCDGFTGNIILKTMEGLGKDIFKQLKNLISQSLKYKIGAFLLKPAFKKLHYQLNPNRVGGAPLLGVNGISVVCHGSSKKEAIASAFKMALASYETKLIENIKNSLEMEKKNDI